VAVVKQSVIARLEDADCEGHSLSMRNRIASALNLRLVVEMTAEEPIVDPENRAGGRIAGKFQAR